MFLTNGKTSKCLPKRADGLRVVIRVDASKRIGLGHLQRCLALAKALRSRGAKCTFLCFFSDNRLLHRVSNAGFYAHTLHKDRLFSLGVLEGDRNERLQADIRLTSDYFSKHSVDWLIVDHYDLDSLWEINFSELCRIVVIDDLFNRPHECDVLLDTAAHSDHHRYDNLVPNRCRKLLSPSFALLNPNFERIRRSTAFEQQRHARLKNILLSLGGTDPAGLTNTVLSYLQSMSDQLQGWLIRVPVLSSSSGIPELMQWEASANLDVQLIFDVEDMSKLLHQTRIAVGSVGVSAFERCCLGVPTVAFVVADNQRWGATRLNDIGVHHLIDPHVLISSRWLNQFCALNL